MSTLQPHQQRVVDERKELIVRLQALQAFFDNPIYKQLDYAEQERLIKQAQAMGMYADVLTERIAVFAPLEPVNTLRSPSLDTSDQAIEQQIVAKGLTAPRVTPAALQANIASTHFFTALQGARMAGLDYAADCGDPTGLMPSALQPSLGLLTFCVLTLQNGFTVTGESACASSENFDPEIGRNIARENAMQKIWPLMGYALKQQLHESTK